MMTTCRLLCALLVLALCCCPSVCAATSGEITEAKAGENLTPQDSVGSNDSDNTRAKNTELNGQSSDKEADSSERPSKKVSTPATSSPTGTGEGPSRVPTLQDGRDASAQPGASEGNNLSPGSTGDSDKSDVNNWEHNKEVALTGKEVKEQAPTTTTKTTTTTTTTTTTAPDAPSDTAMNAEVPTTTTSHAPLRFREIDGSLSGSAWVCAPLLLAVSALVYTTVG
ncbi:mucin TcMUCII [Trypanosoma cruzi cruzi]|uniref:Putative mucin TcMUCII n=1 Tax=Trypanosoma cruzi TaxID=5693 RepID=A0A2V2VP28_TRYCR|nr:mucin TcMUCII [Trypanosoma cruzi cruzi]PWU97476.1 putative mucin TcMUCII [Trypanosoma cruzi]